MVIDSPIDINSDITDQCSGLCALSFNFTDSVCVVVPRREYLAADYDSHTDDSKYFVKYKGVDYKPYKIEISNKSLHLYNGKRTDAELFVFLSGSGAGSGKQLVISIPIEQMQQGASEIKSNGKIVSAIINAITPSNIDMTSAIFESGSTYNLNNVFPSEEPFYTYIGKEMYRSDERGSLVNYVVFPRSSSIYVPASIIVNFNKITKQFVSPLNYIPKNVAAYNSSGANIRESNDVFIECSPAGDDGVILYQTTKDGAAASSDAKLDGDTPFTNIVENDMFVVGIQIIIFGFIGIIIVFLAYKLLMIVSPAEKSAATATGKGAAK
jgi:hypothetical protein